MTDSLLSISADSRREFFESQKGLLGQLAQGMARPKALFVTCSDARISPENLMGADPGELFMLRNIANIVPPYYQPDMSATAVLEFAIATLEIPHLVICGHIDCAGIKTLDAQVDISRQPALSRWLDLARPAKRDVDHAMGDLDQESRHQAIVEHNVIQQLEHVKSYPFVQQALAEDRLELHGWVYYLDRSQVGYYDAGKNRFIIP